MKLKFHRYVRATRTCYYLIVIVDNIRLCNYFYTLTLSDLHFGVVTDRLILLIYSVLHSATCTRFKLIDLRDSPH